MDSNLSQEEMLLQNPNMETPEDMLEQQECKEVTYYSFDRKVHRGQIVMNKKAMEDVVLFFEQAFLLQFPIKSVIPIADKKYQWDDEASCNDNNSSGYNFRYIAGTTKMSNHARGLAFDINPVQNSYIRYNEKSEELWRAPKDATYDTTIPGTLFRGHPLVELLKSKRWTWGGDWKNEDGPVDYQHFELPL